MKPSPERNPVTARRRAAAEAQLEKQNHSRPQQSEADVRRLQHELEVHQIELEMQNAELRAAQQEINAGLERYTELFEFAPVGYFNLTADGTIRLVNLTGAKLLGLERAHLLGKRLHSLVANGDRKNFSDFLARVFAGSENEDCQVQLVTERRPPLFVRLDAKRAVEGDRCRVVMVDVTERKQAEEVHARLAMAVEQSAESIVITDTQGIMLYVNPAFEKTTGYTRAEALGQNPRMLKSGKQSAEFYHQMWNTLKRGEVWHGHFINQRKDGSLYNEEATISPVRDAADKVVNYVASKHDITREVQLETEFRQAQKMEAIGTLAGGVAHDFNNILAIIQIEAGLLKVTGILSPEQAKFADEIDTTVKRGADLTRQLLLFSRKENPKLDDLELNQIITDLAKMLRRVLTESIGLELKLPGQPMFVHADPSMLDQVLINLAVNARDAMAKGGQLVIATAGVEFDEAAAAQVDSAQPGSFVCLSVTDSGCGIPPEILPKIFEPFFTTKPVGKGTGLGLATVFGIVQQHQGWINVSSEFGHGTTFKIYLPRLARLPDKKNVEKILTTIPTGAETILLVEDEPVLRDLIQKTLVQLGYHVLEAPTGVAALGVWKAHREKIHLLLTDMVMPGGLNGKELAQRLLQENSKLKVIYMSGYSLELTDRKFDLQAGVNFLAKPFQMQKLAQIIRARLDAQIIE